MKMRFLRFNATALISIFCIKLFTFYMLHLHVTFYMFTFIILNLKWTDYNRSFVQSKASLSQNYVSSWSTSDLSVDIKLTKLAPSEHSSNTWSRPLRFVFVFMFVFVFVFLIVFVFVSIQQCWINIHPTRGCSLFGPVCNQTMFMV